MERITHKKKNMKLIDEQTIRVYIVKKFAFGIDCLSLPFVERTSTVAGRAHSIYIMNSSLI